jgi:hypothetical protein
LEYESPKWLPVYGTVVRGKAMQLYSHCTVAGGEEKGSSHASKRQFENIKKWLSLHNVKRIEESVSADRITGTEYPEHFKR